MRVDQLAINSVSTRQADLEEALDAYAGAGFRQVELKLRDTKAWLAGRPTVDLQRALEARSLTVVGGFESAVQCFSPPASRQANRALHLANARLLHELGGGVMTVGTDGPEEPSPAALDGVARGLDELATAIRGLDVRIALEFNWSPLVRSLASAVLVCEKVGRNEVGVLFDPAHYYTTATKSEDLTAERVRWVRHVHLDDMRDLPGDLSDCNSDRVLPGEGVVDLGRLIALIENGGYQGSFSIEMFNQDLWALPAAEAARRCYESLLPLCDHVDGYGDRLPLDASSR